MSTWIMVCPPTLRDAAARQGDSWTEGEYTRRLTEKNRWMMTLP
jgi:hypothetical protein